MADDKDKDKGKDDGAGDERTDKGSIGERAENGGEQETLFPEGVLDGDKRTLANLLKKGLPVEVVCVMTAMEVPLRDGLPDPDKLARYAITVEHRGARVKYKREKQPDGSRKIVGYTLVAETRPVYAETLGMGEDAMERSYEQLLAVDPVRAGATLDRLKNHFVKEVGASGPDLKAV
jgi:hypothetical protein